MSRVAGLIAIPGKHFDRLKLPDGFSRHQLASRNLESLSVTSN